MLTYYQQHISMPNCCARQILLQQDQQQSTNEILLAGIDPLISAPALKESLGADARMTRSYKTSRLQTCQLVRNAN